MPYKNVYNAYPKQFADGMHFICRKVFTLKTFDIKALSSDTDIKKFNIDNRTYMNIVEIKRD